MNSFRDIIKTSFLESFNGGITGQVIILSVSMTVVLALYLFLIYRLLGRKSFYNMNFNLSLVGMTIVTAAIVLAIQSNLVLSLGMVGALSIVRYRSAVKDPLDLFFLFWSVAIGIMCGAQQYVLAVVISLVLTVVLYGLSYFPAMRAPYVLVVNGDKDSLAFIKECLEEHCKYYAIKSNHISGDKLRMVVEIKVSDPDSLLLELVSNKGLAVSILTYEGDIVG